MWKLLVVAIHDCRVVRGVVAPAITDFRTVAELGVAFEGVHYGSGCIYTCARLLSDSLNARREPVPNEESGKNTRQRRGYQQ
jgi:hypothetical protein